MIELAPRHKSGLNLSNPVMIASGFCGFGDAYQCLIKLSHFGAIVSQAITLRPQRGKAQPRLVETKGGFILDNGQQNPGVKKVLKRHSKGWSRFIVPIIAHLAADDPPDLRRTAAALASVQTTQGHPILTGLELGIPPQASPQDVERWIMAIQQGCELPIFVKVSLPLSFDISQAAANAYADALVLGTPFIGATFAPQWVSGPFYHQGLPTLVLAALQQLSDFDLPLVACGGIQTISDVENFLKAGATAVQLDSLLLTDPNAAVTIAQSFDTHGEKK